MIIMGMSVDESRRDAAAGDLDDAATADATRFAHRCDAIAIDRDITDETRHAAAIQDGTTAKNKIMNSVGHGALPFFHSSEIGIFRKQKYIDDIS
jgi:hypothetical protein